MKSSNDTDDQRSGLLRGSEPLSDVRHRSAAKKDADSGKDGLLGDKGDDDSGDSDAADSDGADGEEGEDSEDSDGVD